MQNFKQLPGVLLRNPTMNLVKHVAYSAKSVKPIRLSKSILRDSRVFLHTSKSEKRASTLASSHVKSDSRNTVGGEAGGKTVINSYSHNVSNKQRNSGQKRYLAFAINQTKEKASQQDQYDIISETSSNSTSQPSGKHYNDLQEESEMERSHDFVLRHIGPRGEDKMSMLATLGSNSREELIADTVPNKIRFMRKLNLPKQLNEEELLIELQKIAKMNDSINWKSYLGMGYHDCVTPSVILRNMFENPGKFDLHHR